MKLTIGISPCPNDTFIFEPIINHRIDLRGIEFEFIFEDVESLNQMATMQELDVSKLSFHAYSYVSANYQILESGAALGKNCGPILISKDTLKLHQLPYCVVGIPGRFTTANLLLNIAFPEVLTKKEYVFSDIESAILHDEIDAGVIIHENRFTFEKKGLKKILDLGEYWEKEFNHPIPLGLISIRRNLQANLKIKVAKIIQESVHYARNHAQLTMPFVRKHAQEMEEETLLQHIQLYVNTYTESLNIKGKQAINKLFQVAAEKKLIPQLTQPIFLE